MRRPVVDRIEYSRSLFALHECRQWRDPRFLAREYIKFFLLPGGFLLGPFHHLITCDGFNTSNASGNRRFAYNFEPADLTRGMHMSAAAKFHRITVQRLRLPADLDHAHQIAVFLTEELLDIRTVLRFRVRNLRPGHRGVFRDPLIHQLLDRAELLFRERCTREIECQLVRPDVAPLLSRPG